MPKVKYLGTYKEEKPKPLEVPPPDLLNELFDRYKSALRYTDADIGLALNTSANYIRVRRCKGSDKLTVADVREMCKILQITDPTALGRAILGG